MSESARLARIARQLEKLQHSEVCQQCGGGGASTEIGPSLVRFNDQKPERCEECGRVLDLEGSPLGPHDKLITATYEAAVDLKDLGLEP